ncbi:MAG: hypothetical protein EZS28_042879 [Streblomastix strix]|uniref:Protein kinase domain-containing protein n=1 Tax=Streblomastix strix TaxID=222440 RepID=A0A5J4TUL5_9EUKA|nr:MAG: hypothetical protein EZS28_042879 [Streblomastix strix]
MGNLICCFTPIELTILDYCPFSDTCLGLLIIGSFGLSISGIVVTILYGVNNPNYDAGQLAMGAGILLLITIYFTLVALFCCKNDKCCLCMQNPFRHAKYNSDSHTACMVNCFGDICTMPNCGNWLNCGCDPRHCDANCHRYPDEEGVWEDDVRTYKVEPSPTKQQQKPSQGYSGAQAQASAGGGTVTSRNILQGKKYKYEKVKKLGKGGFGLVWLCNIVGK